MRIANNANDVIARRTQQVLCDTKWHTFLTRAWLFRHIPFVEAAFGAGSLAIGNVNENSDFDVLVCAREGRIFTARFFAVVLFGLWGWRRSKFDHGERGSDKICLNHFVTPAAYRLRLPGNSYWQLLYQRLVPLYGDTAIVQKFFDANADWTGQRSGAGDERQRVFVRSVFKKAQEALLAGSLGNWFEAKLKVYQIKRIKRGLPTPGDHRQPHRIVITNTKHQETIQLEPSIIYTDTELDFQPNPAIVELI